MIRCKWRVNYENDIQIEIYTTSAVASQLGRHMNLAFPYIEALHCLLMLFGSQDSAYYSMSHHQNVTDLAHRCHQNDRHGDLQMCEAHIERHPDIFVKKRL